MCTETVRLRSSIPPCPQAPVRSKLGSEKYYPAEKYKGSQLHYLLKSDLGQAPIVQKVDNVIHRINLYPVDIAQLVSQMVDSAIHLFNIAGQDLSHAFLRVIPWG